MANSLVPRWRGSSEDFVAFAERVSDENKALGNIAYARIATVGLLIESDDYREIYPGLQWERIQKGLREIDKRYPDSARTYHLLARFARQYEDRAVAGEAMLRLDPAWDADAKQYWDNPTKFANARRWALANGATDEVGTQVGTYPIAKHGWLVLAVPETFKQSHQFLSDPPAMQLHLRPEIGDAFYVQVSSLWLDPAKRASKT